MENVKSESVLVIPDVHGRDFWREGVAQRKPGELIIFLGDYTDPYPHEFISHDVVPGMLQEILDIPDTVLLLGNHDLSYIYPKQSPAVRKDWEPERLKKLGEIFEDNRHRFLMSYSVQRGKGTWIIFSHAGFLKTVYHRGWRGDKRKRSLVEVAQTVDNMWEDRDPELPNELFRISWYRGGDSESGSFVWADVREHISEDSDFWSHDYQIFGHTMLVEGKVIQTKKFACIDCQRPVRVWIDNKVPKLEVL